MKKNPDTHGPILGGRKRGMAVVFLGPDGAGKSTLINAVQEQLKRRDQDFKTVYFAPGLFKRYRPKGDSSITIDPHNAPQNSQIKNIARMLVFLTEFLVGMPRILKTNPLVLFDRHLIDILVDPKRYRMTPTYWWTRILLRFIPQPEKLVVITAPAEIIQSRKQEVPFAETERQLAGYIKLAERHPDALVIENVGDPNQTAETIVDFIAR